MIKVISFASFRFKPIVSGIYNPDNPADPSLRVSPPGIFTQRVPSVAQHSPINYFTNIEVLPHSQEVCSVLAKNGE